MRCPDKIFLMNHGILLRKGQMLLSRTFAQEARGWRRPTCGADRENGIHVGLIFFNFSIKRKVEDYKSLIY